MFGGFFPKSEWSLGGDPQKRTTFGVRNFFEKSEALEMAWGKAASFDRKLIEERDREEIGWIKQKEEKIT